MKTLDFTQTSSLFRFYLKKGWIIRSIWLLTPALLVMSAAQSYGTMFASDAELAAFVNESILNPVVSAIHGFILSSNIPGIIAWNIKTVALIIVGIFNILAMTRIARGEEENGRADLICSGRVGRQAPLTAAFLLCFATDFAMGLLFFATMLAFGLRLSGAAALSLLITLGGMFFACIGGLTAQLSSSRRMASSLANGLLGAFYMISFLNNLNAKNNISSFFTPFRWFFVVRPFAGDYIVFLLIPLALIAVVIAAAFTLSARRDVGAGMVQPKKGRGYGAPSLKNDWALAWRMQRGSLFVWTIVLGIFALAIGSVDLLVAQMLRDLPVLADWMGLFGEPHEAFRVLMIYVLSLFVAAYGILAVLRLRSEETDGRVDSLLSTRTKRTGLLSSHAVYAVLGPIVMLFVIGFAMSLGGALSGGTAMWGKNLSAAFGKLPAVWVMSGIVVLLFCALPKVSIGISWGIFGLFITLQLLWEMGAVPDALVLLSPFGHVYPSRPQSFPVLVALTLIAALFCAIGLFRFKRRDVVN